ncbi:MAG: hypothetical protein IKB48_06730 [Bacteroidales bacterium]|nr:hypothetical protein [Bacteroidales bacterium]
MPIQEFCKIILHIAASFGVVLLLTLLIVAFQYWRAATVDPADTLQKE